MEEKKQLNSKEPEKNILELTDDELDNVNGGLSTVMYFNVIQNGIDNLKDKMAVEDYQLLLAAVKTGEREAVEDCLTSIGGKVEEAFRTKLLIAERVGFYNFAFGLVPWHL